MTFEIELPDPYTQHRKTPAWIRIFKTGLDQQGNPVKRAVRRFFTVGTDENMRVLRWHEAVDRVRDFVENRTLTELKTLYERIAGEEYDGVSSKRGVLRGILTLWFGLDKDMTLAEMKAWALSHIENDEGDWGLGCPANDCRRYWAFEVKNGRFRFKDRAAYTGPAAQVLDEWDIRNLETLETKHYFKILHWENDIRVVTEVPINWGYLDVNPSEKTFVCDECGANIKLM
jgi:hypothetical protein